MFEISGNDPKFERFISSFAGNGFDIAGNGIEIEVIIPCWKKCMVVC